MKFAVVFGGCSDEHEVSLASAANVINILKKMGHEVLSAGINKSGKNWYLGENALSILLKDAEKELLPKSLSKNYEELESLRINMLTSFTTPPAELHDVDIIFPLIHGKSGEDGTIQALCSFFQKPFIGCGILASSICFNKAFTKEISQFHNIPIVDGILVKREEFEIDFLEIKNRVQNVFQGKPIFVKPNKSGSSLGISQIFNYDELKKALDKGFLYDDGVLIENLIEHREIVVGIVQQGNKYIVSTPGECRAVGSVYDYNEKYIVGNPNWQCPANLSNEQLLIINKLTNKIFKSLHCKDFARVDFFIDVSSGEILLNEVNTVPGFTNSSVFPKLMNATGYSSENLIKMWIDNNLNK